MKKRHVPGFFDALLRTPAFLFLCAMFLCGAIAGGLTGLHASEGDQAFALTGMLEMLPENAARTVLCAVAWVGLPLVCGLLRPPALFISGVCAARGFVLALTIAVGMSSLDAFLVSLCTAGLPALLSVPALLSSATIVWQGVSAEGRPLPGNAKGAYILCIMLSVLSALLRIAFAAFWRG